MADIRRGTIPQAFTDALKLDIAHGIPPTSTADKLLPTFDFHNLRVVDIYSQAATTSGDTTIFSTPATEDFFLTGATIALQSNATADSTGLSLIATINGTTLNLLLIPKLTTTATALNLSRDFIYPIKIDRGTNIILRNAFTVGAESKYGMITGYTVKG